MSLVCPNKSNKEWQSMEQSVGKERAYEIYARLNNDYPTLGKTMEGKPSKLYTALENRLSKEDAAKVYYNIHSIEFADFFGDYIFNPRLSSSHVDESGEPILYESGFVNDGGKIMPLEDLLKDNIPVKSNAPLGELKSKIEADKGVIWRLADSFKARFGVAVKIGRFEEDSAGWVDRGTVYINLNKAGFDTPVHEFSHVLLQLIRNHNTKLWAGLVKELKTNRVAQQYLGRVREEYKDVYTSEEQFTEEALAQMLGDLGTSKIKGTSTKEFIRNLFNKILEFFIPNMIEVNIADLKSSINLDTLSKLLIDPTKEFTVPTKNLTFEKSKADSHTKNLNVVNTIQRMQDLYPDRYIKIVNGDLVQIFDTFEDQVVLQAPDPNGNMKNVAVESAINMMEDYFNSKLNTLNPTTVEGKKLGYIKKEVTINGQEYIITYRTFNVAGEPVEVDVSFKHKKKGMQLINTQAFLPLIEEMFRVLNNESPTVFPDYITFTPASEESSNQAEREAILKKNSAYQAVVKRIFGYDTVITTYEFENGKGDLELNIEVKVPEHLKPKYNYPRMYQLRSSTEKAEAPIKQKENKNPVDREKILMQKIQSFFNNAGIKYNPVTEIFDEDNNPVNAKAKIDILHKVIQVIEGKSTIDTLPEEAAHFFVEMLPADHAGLQAMMRKIEKTAVYEQVTKDYGTVYDNDIEKLKKEAIGKLIAAYVLKEAGLGDKIAQDWVQDYESNKTILGGIWKWLKRQFSKLSSDVLNVAINNYNDNIFRESASEILAGNSSVRSITEAQSYYSLSDEATQKMAIDGFIESQKHIAQKADGEYEVNGQGGWTRVTTYTKELQRKPFKISPTTRQKATWAIDRVTGTLTHGLASNIIKKHFPQQNQHVTTFDNDDVKANPHLKTISSSLEKALLPFIEEAKKDGAVLMSEVKVASSTSKRAGTIDLLRINKDGSADIFDFKTKSKNRISLSQEQEYTAQIEEYSKILSESFADTGRHFVKVNKKRIIPIAKQYDSKVRSYLVKYFEENLKEFEDGDLLPYRSLIYKAISDAILNKSTAINSIEQIPISTELTGNDKLDKLLSKLNKQIVEEERKLIKTKESTLREELIAGIASKKELVRTVQLKKDVDDIAQSAYKDLSYIQDRINAEDFDFDNEYRVFNDVARLYQSLTAYLPSDTPKEVIMKASAATGLASIIIEKLREKSIELIKKEFGKESVIGLSDTELFEPHKATTWWQYMTHGISATHHPLLAGVKMRVDIALGRSKNRARILNDKISQAREKLNNFYGNRSVSNYDVFFQKRADGKETGNLVTKYKPEFWKARQEAINEGDRDWLIQNTEFDEDFYNQKVKWRDERFTRIYKSVYKESIEEGNTEAQATAAADSYIKYLMADWISTYHYKGQPSIIHFNKPTDIEKWLDPQYTKIMNTPALKEFYEVYTEVMTEGKETLPFNIKSNFVPNFTASFLELASTTGLKTAIEGSSKNFITSLEAGNDPWTYGLQSSTGEEINEIPVVGLQQLNDKQKSRDLAQMLSVFGESMYRHQELENIHALVLSVNSLMKSNEVGTGEIETDENGQPKLDKNGQPITWASKGGQYSQKQLSDFIDTIFYGRSREKGAGRTMPDNKLTKALGIANKNISGTRMLDKGLMYVALKNLGLNLFSPTVNLLQGTSSALAEGAGGRYYSNADFLWAMGQITRNGPWAKAFTKKFDIVQREFTHREAAKLSNVKGKRVLKTDNLLQGQELGETLVQNAVLLAHLKSGKGRVRLSDYKLVNGKAVWNAKHTEHTEDEYILFESAVKKLNKKIIGNYDPEDRMAAKKTIVGRALLQHKTWLPAMFENRFGSEKYDYLLDQRFIGRYKVLVKAVAWDMFKIMAKKGFFFTNSKDFGNLPAHYVHAMKANMMEALMIGILLALKFGLDDDDPDRPGAVKYTQRTITRLLAENTFFISPKSFTQIVQSPAASISAWEDLGRLLTHSYKQTWGFVTSNEELMKSATPWKYVKKNTPIVGQFDRFAEFMAE